MVVSQFNTEITGRLLDSALTVLAADERIKIGPIVRVPGSFEIPFAAKMMARGEPSVDAVICLGVILQGGTDQNTHLARACAIGLQWAQLETGVPMTFGLISAPSVEVAMDRTRGELDRGREAALAAIEMAELKLKRRMKTDYKDLTAEVARSEAFFSPS